MALLSSVIVRPEPDSDADIAVVLVQPLELLDQAVLADRLTQAMSVPAVDLLDLERAAADDRVHAGRYLVQVAAQTCIDIANHVIASEGQRSPRDIVAIARLITRPS